MIRATACTSDFHHCLTGSHPSSFILFIANRDSFMRNCHLMPKPFLLLVALCASFFVHAQQAALNSKEHDYVLVWSDEFNTTGSPDTSIWDFEHGFVRNREAQWYQPQNATCRKGRLVIKGRKETKPNPLYDSTAHRWQQQRPQIEYTSASITTRKSLSWQYGKFEIRARITTQAGLWPAIWTLGVKGEWPSNGEIDIMEYYKGDILANVACGTAQPHKARWFSTKKAVSSFSDEKWSSKFHVWRMDWDKDAIKLYVDDLLLNDVKLNDATNADGSNPFRQPHYLLLNLALGGDNGGDLTHTRFPSRYEIDYVRVYQKK